MIIDCISDLHGNQPVLKGGDLLIVAGDMTARDKPSEWRAFYNWLLKQRYRKIIMIAGNHDGVLTNVISTAEMRLLPLEEADITPANFEYLRDNYCIFEGLKIYGIPWTPTFLDWHFMKDRGAEMKAVVDLIPEDVDILVSHGPHYGCLDVCESLDDPESLIHVGCEELANRLKSLKSLKLHVFGHVHEGYGFTHSYIDKGDEVQTVLHINASIMNANYYPINRPVRVILEGKEAILAEGSY